MSEEDKLTKHMAANVMRFVRNGDSYDEDMVTVELCDDNGTEAARIVREHRKMRKALGIIVPEVNTRREG